MKPSFWLQKKKKNFQRRLERTTLFAVNRLTNLLYKGGMKLLLIKTWLAWGKTEGYTYMPIDTQENRNKGFSFPYNQILGFTSLNVNDRGSFSFYL